MDRFWCLRCLNESYGNSGDRQIQSTKQGCVSGESREVQDVGKIGWVSMLSRPDVVNNNVMLNSMLGKAKGRILNIQ